MKELTFVKVSGVLFVGLVEVVENEPERVNEEPAVWTTGLSIIDPIIILENPRMVFANQEEGTISFGKCIGNPDQLEIGKFDFKYVNKDPEVTVFYNEEFKIEDPEITQG